MLFNYGIIGSYLFTAFLIYFVGRIVTLPQKAVSDERKFSLRRNDLWLLLRLLFLVFALVISFRLVFLFAFPSELEITGIQLPWSYGFLGWLNAQAVLVMLYLYYLVLLGLYFRMKVDNRVSFLTATARGLSRLIFIDVFILFSAYEYVNYTFLFPHIHAESLVNIRHHVPFRNELFFILPLLVIPYIFLYIQYRKKQTPFYLKMYGIFFIIILLLSISISWFEVDQYYQLSESFGNRISLYALSDGFFGWFWIFIIMLTILSFSMIFKIRKLKEDFITIQFYMNMMSHSIRFNFSCTIAIVILSLVPLVVRYIYS